MSDCGCVFTDDRTGLCAKHFLALLDDLSKPAVVNKNMLAAIKRVRQ